MRWLSPLRFGIVLTLMFGIGLAACDHKTEPLSDPSGDPEALAELSPPGAGATTGPWSKCTLGPDDTDGVPEVCPDPVSKGCGGFSSMIVDLDDGNELCIVANFCVYQCNADADCPGPPSGEVTPICREQECYLPCSDNSQCPDGMICYDDGSIENGVGAMCEWAYACPKALER